MKLIYPEYRHFEAQNFKESILTSDGRYDLNKLSDNELSTILGVIGTVNAKYSQGVRSVGMFNEVYALVYKARNILMQLIVERYGASERVVDIFACACALSQQGAYRRNAAIDLFEQCNRRIPAAASVMVNCSPLVVYNDFAKLYEQKKEFAKSIEMLRLAKAYAPKGVPYYAKKIAELRERKPIAYKPRTTPQSTIEYFNLLETAASNFVYLVE